MCKHKSRRFNFILSNIIYSQILFIFLFRDYIFFYVFFHSFAKIAIILFVLFQRFGMSDSIFDHVNNEFQDEKLFGTF